MYASYIKNIVSFYCRFSYVHVTVGNFLFKKSLKFLKGHNISVE